MRPTASRLILGLLLLGLLSACGFQLRGQVAKLQGLSQPLFIKGVTPDSTLDRELRQQLRQAGATLSDDAEQAGTMLQISQVRSDERVLGLDSRNRATEYELQESLRFSLREKGQGERIPEQRLHVTRTLVAPQSQVLARQQEAQALRGDMQRELVNLLIRRLAALL